MKTMILIAFLVVSTGIAGAQQGYWIDPNPGGGYWIHGGRRNYWADPNPGGGWWIHGNFGPGASIQPYGGLHTMPYSSGWGSGSAWGDDD